MKPKLVHILFKKGEEEWNNKKDIYDKLATDGATGIVGANVVLIISKIKTCSFQPLMLYDRALSLPDRALILKLFYNNSSNSADALREFRRMKGMCKGKGPSTPCAVRRIVKKFEETGSLTVKCGRGRKPLPLRTQEVIVLHITFQTQKRHLSAIIAIIIFYFSSLLPPSEIVCVQILASFGLFLQATDSSK